ncbi:MAG: bacillithiol biosynthesis BshC [Promethearchaeota archaeon]
MVELTFERSLTDLYSSAALGYQTELARKFWGEIPQTLGQIPSLVMKKRKQWIYNDIEESFELLRELLVATYQKFGILTIPMKETINNLSDQSGIIEVSHQTLFMGGQPFLFNKVSFTDYFSRYSEKDNHIFPLFYIADYDVVQNELTLGRIPNANSYQGTVLKILLKGFTSGISQVSGLKPPTDKWFVLARKQILKAYRSLFRLTDLSLEQRQLFEERLEASIDIIEDAALHQNNFADWVGEIWGRVFNIRNKLKIPLFLASDQRFRSIMLPGYEKLLSNRLEFIGVLNEIRSELEELGYKPRIPYRTDDYVPFFYECPQCKLTRPRIKLICEERNSDIILSGGCPICREEFEFSFSKTNPDLSDIGAYLSPRVDTRASAIATSLPIAVHVGGPGENEYYAQVVPAMKKIDLIPPIFVKYTRIMYNTPWNEALANQLQKEGHSVIQTSLLFNHIAEFAKTRENEAILSHLIWMKDHLKQVFEDLINKEREISEKYAIKSNRTPQLRNAMNNLRYYLSHAYGRISRDKSIQENAFLWFDLALLTGIKDFSGLFCRQFREQMPPGSVWYVSSQNFEQMKLKEKE